MLILQTTKFADALHDSPGISYGKCSTSSRIYTSKFSAIIRQHTSDYGIIRAFIGHR